MGASMKELGLDRLTPDQKIALAMEIWESLDQVRPSNPLTSELREELARRDAELNAEPGLALAWEQVRSSAVRRQSITLRV